MKIIKIIIAFVFLVSALFFLLNWNDIISPKQKVVENSRQSKVQLQCDSIRKAWAQEDNWNDQLFSKQYRDIKQSSGLGILSVSEANTVNDCLREQVCQKVYDAMMREFHSAAGNDNRIEYNCKGALKLRYIYVKDFRLAKILLCYNLYKEISKFVRGSHSIVAHYDRYSNSWNSFQGYRNSILSMARRYRSNGLYQSHLKNITRLSRGLNEVYLKKKLDVQEKTFYYSLYRQIVNHFEYSSHTRSNKYKLRTAFGQYADETSYYSESFSRYLSRY